MKHMPARAQTTNKGADRPTGGTADDDAKLKQVSSVRTELVEFH